VKAAAITANTKNYPQIQRTKAIAIIFYISQPFVINERIAESYA